MSTLSEWLQECPPHLHTPSLALATSPSLTISSPLHSQLKLSLFSIQARPTKQTDYLRN